MLIAYDLYTTGGYGMDSIVLWCGGEVANYFQYT